VLLARVVVSQNDLWGEIEQGQWGRLILRIRKSLFRLVGLMFLVQVSAICLGRKPCGYDRPHSRIENHAPASSSLCGVTVARAKSRAEDVQAEPNAQAVNGAQRLAT